MTYNFIKVGRNEAILEYKKGNSIKIIFSESDDYKTEAEVMQSLLTSYEQRIRTV